jgi:HAD superfamily hydrolase (TIGR01509 family)
LNVASGVNMTEAVLFDSDGVLVDTESLFFDTTQKAFRRLDLNLTPEIWAHRYLSRASSSRAVALSLGADPKRVDQVVEERDRQFRRLLQNASLLRPFVRETLTKLQGVVKLAIVTGGDRDHFALAHATSGVLSYFDVIVTSDDCSNGKPHPEPYLTAIRKLGVDAQQCLAVEDTPRGLASAISAGVPCVVVPTWLTCMLPFPGALAIEQDLSGVLRYVRLGAVNR